MRPNIYKYQPTFTDVVPPLQIDTTFTDVDQPLQMWYMYRLYRLIPPLHKMWYHLYRLLPPLQMWINFYRCDGTFTDMMPPL